VQASWRLEIGVLGEKLGYLGLDRLRQQGARSVAQHLGERIGKRPWLKQLDDVRAVSDQVAMLRGGFSVACRGWQEWD
jgi:hypothetical protein